MASPRPFRGNSSVAWAAKLHAPCNFFQPSRARLCAHRLGARMKEKEELKMAPVLQAWKPRRLQLLGARTWEETWWQEGQDVTFFVVQHEKQGLWVRQIGSFHLSVSW